MGILSRFGEGTNCTPLGSEGENRSVNFLLIFLLGLMCGGVVGRESLSCFIQKQSGVLVGDMHGVRRTCV